MSKERALMTETTALGDAEIDLLLVEDNASDAELAVRELRRHKFANRIHVVRDGAQALDFVFCRGAYSARSFSRPPKVILLDMKLPKVSGLEVLKAIKGDPRTRALPVVVMTSSAEQRDLIESYKFGVNAYIQKPIDFEAFRQVIERFGMFWLAVNSAPPAELFEDDSTVVPILTVPEPSPRSPPSPDSLSLTTARRRLGGQSVDAAGTGLATPESGTPAATSPRAGKRR
jgi:two-component system, response regulator